MRRTCLAASPELPFLLRLIIICLVPFQTIQIANFIEDLTVTVRDVTSINGVWFAPMRMLTPLKSLFSVKKCTLSVTWSTKQWHYYFPIYFPMLETSVFIPVFSSKVQVPFSALTLLVGRQEGHPACKKLGVGLLVVMIWLELCTAYSSSFHHHFHHPLLQ